MRLARSTTTLVLTFVLSSYLLFASGVNGQTHAVTIDSLMRALVEREQFNGSILVADHGRVIVQRGFGSADRKRDIAFTADTPVYLASLSKQFTAMAIMILAEHHKLSYDDTLSIYFQELPPYAQKITIRQLLNHTSGMPNYVSLGMEHAGLTNADVINALTKKTQPDFAAGDQFEYSNSNYVLLAAIIEKVSGQSYPQFLKQQIFAPLQMDHTFVYTKHAANEPRAHGYNRFGDDDDYDLLTYGEGGIYSTARDMFKWDRALYTEKLVKQSTLREAFTPGKLNDGQFTNYGFGWGISEVNGVPVYSHAGRYGGFDTYIKRFPSEDSVIIFLTNHDFKNMSAIGNALISVLHDQPYALPKLSIAELLFKTYRAKEISAAVEQYRALKKNNDGAYDFSESELNELGYELLGKYQPSDAVEILKLNVEAYPDTWNVYDGLAEAYMKNGNRELAIANYKKSLALNPKNTNAVTMLKQLGAP